MSSTPARYSFPLANEEFGAVAEPALVDPLRGDCIGAPI
jgi:hypothetical protein